MILEIFLFIIFTIVIGIYMLLSMQVALGIVNTYKLRKELLRGIISGDIVPTANPEKLIPKRKKKSDRDDNTGYA